MMVLLKKDPKKFPIPEFDEIETKIVKLIDRIRVTLDFQNKCFQKFEKNILYPFLKLLIKKFLSYFILKKLVDIANQCEMITTSEKISGSLKSLEKKLFKNNKLHENKKEKMTGELDLDQEMKNKLGFDINNHQNNTSMINNRLSIFKKKIKKVEPIITKNKKQKEIIPLNESMGRNRSSLFYNKFIRKNKQQKGSGQIKNPIEPLTVKKVIQNSTMFGNVNRFNRRSMPLAQEDIPDFFKLNKMIANKGNGNIINLNEKKRDKRIENYKKDKIKNRKLPNLIKQKLNQRRGIRTSFSYTKLLKNKKNVEDMNNENIINLQSRADILKEYEQEIMKNLNVNKSFENISMNIESSKENKVIGNVTKSNTELFDNLNKNSKNDGISKLDSKFISFSMKENENYNFEKKSENFEESNIINEHKIEANPFMNSVLALKSENKIFDYKGEDLGSKKTKDKLEEVVYEICTNDWENNIFGKHTPNKDFLRTEVTPDVNS